MWGWALLPILLAIWGTVGFWVVARLYLLGFLPFFPSTCGSDPPQSCIFSQVLNVGAFLVVWISCLRFQQVQDWGGPCALNAAGLCLGLLCALGASLVGNFQQNNQLETHLFGAFLAFIVGVVYFWVQAVLTHRVKPQRGRRWIGEGHRPLLLLDSGSVFTLHGLGLRSEAAACEWTLALTLFLLFGLFAVDFRHIESCSLRLQRQAPAPTLELGAASTQTLAP
uniref:CWH43-like N-terminal domain-containing protein n=1 Tax=Gopherus agassizii TaxID=38772 RepID=A0A452H245_9SAUR